MKLKSMQTSEAPKNGESTNTNTQEVKRNIEPLEVEPVTDPTKIKEPVPTITQEPKPKEESSFFAKAVIVGFTGVLFSLTLFLIVSTAKKLKQ